MEEKNLKQTFDLIASLIGKETWWITINCINNKQDNNHIYITLTFENKMELNKGILVNLPRKAIDNQNSETSNALPLRLSQTKVSPNKKKKKSQQASP